MADKPKYIFTPSSPQYVPSGLRTSFQAMSYNNLHHQNSNNISGGNTNQSNNLQSKTYQFHDNLIGKPKNFSMNIKQLEGKIQKIQNVCSNFKKQELQNTNTKYQNDNIELRNSLSTNQIRRLDVDYLRKTTNLPKGVPFFNQKQFNQSYQSTQVNSQQTDVKSPPSYTSFNINNVFVKKSVEPNQSTEYLSPTNAKFSGKNSYLKQSGHHKEQRKSLNKKSPIICGFYLGRSLGNGKFGQVYLAKHIVSGFVCALKKIQKAKVRQYNMINQLIQQIKIQCFLQHPNIVQFYGVISDEHHIYIIMEYMEGGTLFDYLGTKQYLQQPEAAVFLRQIVQAVKFMHDKNIIHRDIKPQNIVLSYGLAKLCDFGWAARVVGTRKTYCGTSVYFPPEIVQRKQYDQSVDVWCLGILTYEILTGKVPFEHKQKKIMFQKIVNVDKDKIQYPQNISKQGIDFIQNLIKKNPDERLKSYKILQHSFLRKKQDQKYRQ